MKCFTNLDKRYPHFALFTWKNLKTRFISFLNKRNFLWVQIHSFQNLLIILLITPQSSIFGFIDHKVNYHLINHILLIFKYYVYKTKENGSLGLKDLKRNIHEIKNIEKQISFNIPEKRRNFEQKWKPMLENTWHAFWNI